MPTLSVKRDALFKALGKSYTDAEFSSLCFDFGIELDEVVVTEGQQGEPPVLTYKIDLPANRSDLLSLEGLAVALLVFEKRAPFPDYKTVVPQQQEMQNLIILPDTKRIRPFAVAAVLRNINFTQESYDSFIDLQDKLHHNIARKRTLVAIGTHDLDTIKGPFTYNALPPSEIRFKPLNQEKEYTAVELMELYSTHAQLKQYLPIIRNSPVYPVITDANGVVLSLPPIINGDHSKITLNTKNVFIEVTATNLHKAQVVLDTVVTAFSSYCKDKYKIEICEVTWSDGRKQKSPHFSYRKEIINAKALNHFLGINASCEQIVELLKRMCFEAKWTGGSEIVIKIPPTRHDILHAVDVYEDVAIAYGYNNIAKTIPSISTFSYQLPVNKLSDQLREEIAFSGFTEALTFTLCSRDDVSSKLRLKEDVLKDAVHISNPKTLEFQVARNTLLPGLLKTVASNKSVPLPIKLFEVSDVILTDQSTETNARNERRIAAVYYDKRSGFETIHGLLDRIMQLLEVPWDKTNGYYLQGAEDETFFPMRSAQVLWKGKEIGKIGILHPEVMTNFDLSLPCSALELNIEHFLHSA